MRTRKTSKQSEAALNSPIVNEKDLPYPVVYYPGGSGAFFAFSQEGNESNIVLCSCSELAVINYLELKSLQVKINNSDPLRMAPLDSFEFPRKIAEISLRNPHNPISELKFVDGICHRCNLKPPTLRYCHEMYGGKFIQQFGWYYNQQFFKLGITGTTYLSDVCPTEYQEDIKRIINVNQELQIETERINQLIYGPKRTDIPPDEVVYSRNVRMEDAQELKRLNRLASQTHRSLTKKIENIVRQEFGFKKVGEGWVSETLLFQLVENIFPSYEVIRHHRPQWLEGLELDIFIPDLKLAFEYQGQQHFHPIKAWGGESALKKVKERDQKKAMKCEELGITLIEVLFTEPLTDEHIRSTLLDKGYNFK